MPVCFSDAKSPLIWERAWQAELDRRFPKHLSASQVPCMTQMDNLNAGGFALSEGVISCATLSHDQLCSLQQDLMKFVGDKCATDDFEEKWRSAGDKVRAKHYFEAMSRACEIPDMEDQREWAPEVSLNRFQINNGQGYLDMIRLLMPQRDLPGHYVRIEDPVVDAMFGLKAPVETGKPAAINPAVFMRQMMDVRRCLFTTFVVWNILLSFYNLSETVVNVKSSVKADSKGAREFANALGDKHLSEGKVRAIAKETKQLQKEKGVWMCASCGKFEFQASEAFKSCGKCKTIGRIVMYCGRGCQVNDWKTGNPPHKTICGKPTSSIPATQSPLSGPVSDSTSSKAPSFRRSPALLHQISLLKEDSRVDYVLMQPAPLPDAGIACQNKTASLLFRLLRDRAFETGDPKAVRAMYLQLRGIAMSQTGYQTIWLEKQLKTEFGVDVTEVSDE